MLCFEEDFFFFFYTCEFPKIFSNGSSQKNEYNSSHPSKATIGVMQYT